MLIKRLVVKELNFYRLNKIKAGLKLLNNNEDTIIFTISNTFL
jgi:hypothetical protein